MNLVTTLVGLLGMLAGIIGCGNPYAHTYCSQKPNQSDFVSEWYGRDKAARLILRADGTAIGSGSIIPPYLSDTPICKATWKLVPYQDWWAIEMKWSPNTQNPSGILTPLFVVGNSPPYELQAIIGDPDEGKVVVMKQKENEDGKRARADNGKIGR